MSDKIFNISPSISNLRIPDSADVERYVDKHRDSSDDENSTVSSRDISNSPGNVSGAMSTDGQWPELFERGASLDVKDAHGVATAGFSVESDIESQTASTATSDDEGANGLRILVGLSDSSSDGSLKEIKLESSDNVSEESWEQSDIETGAVRSGNTPGTSSPGMDKDLFCGDARFLPLTSCKGTGGCCLTWMNAQQVIKAGLIQGASTALTFGTKPLVEAAVSTVLGSVCPPVAAAMTAAIVSGVYVGAVHTTFGKIASGLLNSAWNGSSYQNRSGDAKAFLGELGTIDAPVYAAFVAGYGVRGELVKDVGNIWALAGSMSVASIGAGIVQGAMTDALRQTLVKYQAVYNEAPSRDLSGGQLKFVKDTFNQVWFEKQPQERFLHDVAGKIVGGAVGMAAAKYFAGAEDLTPTLKGGTGMLIFLTGWFGGIHAGQGVGKLIDQKFGNDMV